ncbi:MAG: nucleotidyltransferase substrate binding protein [Puniceicoccales bacterium]|jgi:nucleotidyltransferase substrate binding protein (TIGR01987 family)|nr:nucleotidyltransferase substrate binding protein [Puniceicoccales bacterium]
MGGDGFFCEPLVRAVGTLEEAWNLARERPADLVVRDGAIQRFEYTYELATRTLRRYLTLQALSGDEVAQMGFKNLIREANVRGLLRGDVTVWEGFRAARNQTCHTYQAPVADKVFAQIPAFIGEVKFFLAELQRREGEANGGH